MYIFPYYRGIVANYSGKFDEGLLRKWMTNSTTANAIKI